MKKRIIFCVLFLIITICFSIFLFKILEKREEELKTKKLEPDSKIVQELYQKVHPSNDATILKELYEKNTITNAYQISIGITEYLKTQNKNLELIEKKDVEESIHNLFGSNFQIKHQSIYLLNDYGCGYEFNKDSQKYEQILGCGGSQFESFQRKIVDATENKDTIKITEKVIYIYNDWDDFLNRISVYNNYQKEELLDYFEKPIEENYQIQIENYIEKASTYIYTFHKQNGNYLWEAFEKVD